MSWPSSLCCFWREVSCECYWGFLLYDESFLSCYFQDFLFVFALLHFYYEVSWHGPFFKIYLYMAVLGLYYCVWLSLVALSGSYCFAVASLCSSFSCCRAWALGMWASVVTAHGLRSCGLWALEHWLSSCGTWAFSCSMACGIFLNQGLNHCPHHWQADS